jgi:hypothetical protein
MIEKAHALINHLLEEMEEEEGHFFGVFLHRLEDKDDDKLINRMCDIAFHAHQRGEPDIPSVREL